MPPDRAFEFLYAYRHPRVRGAALVLLGSTAFLLLMLFVFWLPARHTSQALNNEIDHLRRVAHDKRYSMELAVAVKQAAPQIGEAEKKLDQQNVQSLLVQHLDRLAKRHGLRILSSSYDESKEQSGFLPMSHELAVQGSYAGLRGFLADIPDLPTLTVVEDCSIARVREGGGLKAALLFRTWRRSNGLVTAR